MTGLPVYVARADTGHCCRCGAVIKQGQEFAVEAWSGGFDHMHVECPAPADNTGPRVIQQDPPSKRRSP